MLVGRYALCILWIGKGRANEDPDQNNMVRRKTEVQIRLNIHKFDLIR